MVSEIPELKEQTRYPRFQNELYDVMPIRCRCVCVRHCTNLFLRCIMSLNQLSDCCLCDLLIFASFRPRRQVKKAGKKQAIDLAMFYLETKKRYIMHID